MIEAYQTALLVKLRIHNRAMRANFELFYAQAPDPERIALHQVIDSVRVEVKASLVRECLHWIRTNNAALHANAESLKALVVERIAENIRTCDAALQIHTVSNPEHALERISEILLQESSGEFKVADEYWTNRNKLLAQSYTHEALHLTTMYTKHEDIMHTMDAEREGMVSKIIAGRRQRDIAWALVTHRRVGGGSIFNTLPSDVLRIVLEMLYA
jgi:hypothetical protein